jgi:hypothetical protein
MLDSKWCTHVGEPEKQRASNAAGDSPRRGQAHYKCMLNGGRNSCPAAMDSLREYDFFAN